MRRRYSEYNNNNNLLHDRRARTGPFRFRHRAHKIPSLPQITLPSYYLIFRAKLARLCSISIICRAQCHSLDAEKSRRIAVKRLVDGRAANHGRPRFTNRPGNNDHEYFSILHNASVGELFVISRYYCGPRACTRCDSHASMRVQRASMRRSLKPGH